MRRRSSMTTTRNGYRRFRSSTMAAVSTYVGEGNTLTLMSAVWYSTIRSRI